MIKNVNQMEIVKISAPYTRIQRLLLTSQKDKNIKDFSLMASNLYPDGGKTEYHIHDVDEAIYIVSGYGESIEEGVRNKVEAGCVIYIPAGRKHQVVNESVETMKMLCFFIPSLPEKKLAAFFKNQS